MIWPDITTPDGRRAYSFMAICGGCIVFTGFAAVGLYLVRASAWFTFWLALAAHGQILVGMTAFSFVLGRRVKIKGSRDAFEIDDSGGEE